MRPFLTIERREQPGAARVRMCRFLLTGLAVLGFAPAGCVPAEVSSSPSKASVAEVTVGPSADNLLVGDSQQLLILLKDGTGRLVTGRDVSWTSLNPEIAGVSPTGVVSGRSSGTAQIVASSEGQRGTAVITVWPVRKDTAECDAPKPGWLWCDDFEKDRMDSYFEYGSVDGSFVRAPGVGYGGSTGMRARFSRKGQVWAGFLHLAIGKTPSSYFRPV